MNVPCLFGVNYESASFDFREQMSFDIETIKNTIYRLQSSGITREVLILSTCNRTEVYCVTNDIQFVINAICDLKNICPRNVKDFFYIKNENDCVEHLFRVVSGLESMVLGETEIASQVKDALNIAKEAGGISINLITLFQMAMEVKKEVHNITGINNISISYGHSILKLISKHFNSFDNEKVLFIGAGKMISQVLQYFNDIKCNKKMVLSRTLRRAKVVALPINAQYDIISNLEQIIAEYTIIICAYKSNNIIINEQLLKLLNKEQKVVIMDLSLPLIVDANNIPNSCVLYKIEDLIKVINIGKEKRREAANNAQPIIKQKILDYNRLVKKRNMIPLIKGLRSKADKIRSEVLIASLKQIQKGEDPSIVLENMATKLTNKLIHDPTINLTGSLGKLNHDLSYLVQYLYDLEV